MPFCRADEKFIKILKVKLNVYDKWSRLKANPGKSNVFIFGISREEKERLIATISFEEGSLLFRYLKVSLLSKKLTLNNYKPFVEKIIGKILFWKSWYLSYTSS